MILKWNPDLGGFWHDNDGSAKQLWRLHNQHLLIKRWSFENVSLDNVDKDRVSWGFSRIWTHLLVGKCVDCSEWGDLISLDVRRSDEACLPLEVSWGFSCCLDGLECVVLNILIETT